MKTLKFLLVSSIVFLLSGALFGQTEAWVVPAKFKAMKNPVAVNDASMKVGQTLYTRTCTPCHGKTGLGDGVKVRSLKTAVNDMSKAEYLDQSDGDLFYKTQAGRGDMPKYEGKLSDEDIWSIINYTRTFKK